MVEVRCPSSLKELRSLPHGTERINLRGINELVCDNHLTALPGTIRYLNLTGARKLRDLSVLAKYTKLAKADCSLCSGLTQESIDKLKQASADLEIDLWGCWQLTLTNPKVNEMCTSIFTDYLGVRPS